MLDLIKSWAIDYSAIVNVVLTTLLVTLTAFYAVVTRRMWREMVEARLAGIRPILHVDAQHPELVEAEGPSNRRISGSLTIHNFGRGPAYAPDLDLDLRYEHEGSSGNRVGRHKGPSIITTNLADHLPPALLPGAQINAKWEIYPFPTPMNDSSTDFLRVTARCRDGEGNFYCLTQSYDLRAFALPSVVSRTWALRSEEWRVGRLPGYRRRWSGDLPTAQMTLLSRYRLPREFDWSAN